MTKDKKLLTIPQLQKQYLKETKDIRTEDNDVDLWMSYVRCAKANKVIK